MSIAARTSSPAQLGLRLLRRLPKILTQRFEVLVLADTAFGSNEFITEVRRLKYHALRDSLRPQTR